MTPIPIDDADDPRIATYRDIRERDLVGRQGRFVAEGKVVLDVLFSAGRFFAESVLILDSRLAGMAETLAKAPADMPVYVASRAVMDAVAGFPMHRGVLAVGLRRADERSERLLAALPAPGTGDRAGRHLQPRQYGRDLPQRRSLRRRRRAARRNLLRPALPQGDPGLGRCGAESSVRHRRPGDSLARCAGRAWLQPDRTVAARPRRHPRRSSGANGWRSISEPKAKAARRPAGPA